jgi:ATP-dependent helicase/nuclease subunit A
MTFTPEDAEARERARRDHGNSFVIEAGAGTGKTTLLIDRIEALLTSGHAELDQIAAVTYTENAAGTLKLRLRERLERVRADGPPAAREAAERALGALDRAAIATIHSFCVAILQERPLECGVVPGFRVIDEAEADLVFAEAWDEWLGTQLTRGDDAVLAALDAGIPLSGRSEYEDATSLRGLARNLIRQRDLDPLVADTVFDPIAARAALLARAERARVLTRSAPDSDAMAAGLLALASLGDAVRTLEGEALALRLLTLGDVLKKVTVRSGDKGHWTSEADLAEAREIVRWARESVAEWNAARSATLHGRLVRALAGMVRLYEAKKAESGVLDFLDLLVKARESLRRRESLRAYFAARYPFLIIDEFQDTDPLQVQVAELLSAGRAGALTVVGDPKQSIYRFRRADVRLFAQVTRQANERPGHAVLRLTQNFRSRPAILRFVNRVFAELIQPSDESAQPPYEPIAPPPSLSEEPSVLALHYPAVDENLLPSESQAIVRFLQEVARGAYAVRDPVDGRDRPSRPGDVMVLARRLTQAQHLEDALEAAGMRFVVEGGKSFFDRQEVHEVLSVLRAVDDPADRTSLVAALRSSFFGVSDRDIACYVLGGGWLRIGEADMEKPGAPALAPALELLDVLHKERRTESPAALLEKLYDQTRILAALTGTRRGLAQLANLEKVVAMARQAESLGALTLRGFADLLETRLRERSDEPDLPSTRPGDPATVRIMTIHKAKGLEAPIVVLYDGTDNARPIINSVALWEENRIAIGFRRGCQPPRWEPIRNADELRARAELVRLLYVACTRARDWLVIPVPPEGVIAGELWKPLVQRLPERSDADVQIVDTETLPLPEPRVVGIDLRELAGAEGGDPIAARWERDRRALLEAAAVRPFVPISATKVAAREAPPPVVASEAGGGRAFGALVHRIMQWLPLEEPEGALPMAEALAPSFGLDAAAAQRAAQSVVRALALPVMERARRAVSLYRELPVWLPQEGELIEGVVDLAFEEDGALIVVDYKTDAIAEDGALDQAAHHAPQLRLYARALTLATGTTVRERLVLFTQIPRVVPV